MIASEVDLLSRTQAEYYERIVDRTKTHLDSIGAAGGLIVFLKAPIPGGCKYRVISRLETEESRRN